MTLPLLPGMHPSIAGKELVAIACFDNTHGRVGPGEAVVGIGERRLRLIASGETLRGRRDDDWLRQRGLERWRGSQKSGWESEQRRIPPRQQRRAANGKA